MMTSFFPTPKNATSQGISQVQWMAGLAMQALIAKADGIPDSVSEREEIALWSYRMAQAMQAMENQIHLDDAEQSIETSKT